MAQKSKQREVLEDASLGSRKSLQWLLSVLVAVLPAAWRRGIEERFNLLPDTVAVASSLIQTALFLTLWGLGLAAYMTATPMTDAETFDDTIVVFYNPALPIVYLLTTLRGSLTALAAVGGAVRLFSAVAGHGNLPDPTLSFIEFLRRQLLRKSGDLARRRAIGERSPDRVEHAQGDEAWDLRIVSCDRYDWNEGAGVQALGRPWTVLAVRDVTDDSSGRLRVSHELRKPRAAEVVRGRNAYEPLEQPQVIGEARERDLPGPAVEERAFIPLSPADPKRQR